MMSELMENPWNVAGSDFPAAGSAADQLRFLLNYAVLAPSRHNTQPWLFRIEGNTVELLVDRSRSLPAVDPNARELIISCGAALANLLIAIRHFGYTPLLSLPSRTNVSDVLASVTLERGSPANREEELLFEAIPKRRTNRQVFDKQIIPRSLLEAMEDVARQEGVVLQIVLGKAMRASMVNLIATGDRLLWEDEQFRQEIAAWTHPTAQQALDGVPAYALGKADLSDYLGSLLIHSLMARDEEQAEDYSIGSPALALLWTFSDTWIDWLAAGRALQRVLLYARTKGIWASFFSQPIEVPEIRKEVCALFERTEFPQLVLRLGYGSDVLPTPRRSVHDVLL